MTDHLDVYLSAFVALLARVRAGELTPAEAARALAQVRAALAPDAARGPAESGG